MSDDMIADMDLVLATVQMIVAPAEDAGYSVVVRMCPRIHHKYEEVEVMAPKILRMNRKKSWKGSETLDKQFLEGSTLYLVN